MTKNIFSEYELRQQRIKVAGTQTFEQMSCVGSSEEELEVKIITKKCRGVIAKERVKGTGNGTLKESLHVPRDIYNKIYDMNHTDLVKNVNAYGQSSTHPEFALTQMVVDEDEEVKLKAYPRCILESGPTRKIDNGAEEVAELDLTIKLLPDEYGFCTYEILVKDLPDDQSITIETWMSSFDSATMRAE